MAEKERLDARESCRAKVKNGKENSKIRAAYKKCVYITMQWQHMHSYTYACNHSPIRGMKIAFGGLFFSLLNLSTSKNWSTKSLCTYARMSKRTSLDHVFSRTNYFPCFSFGQLCNEHNFSEQFFCRRCSACEATRTECEFNCMRAAPVAYTTHSLCVLFRAPAGVRETFKIN